MKFMKIGVNNMEDLIILGQVVLPFLIASIAISAISTLTVSYLSKKRGAKNE